MLARQVSLQTLLKISTEFRIQLKRGRRPASIAVPACSAAEYGPAGNDSQAIRFQHQILQDRIQ